VTTTVTTTIRIEPRGASLALMSCRVREVVLDGPAGTGKSHGCLTKFLLAALKYPGMRALFVRQTAESLRDSTMVEWRDTVAAAAIAAGTCVFYSGSATEAHGYRFANGSRISMGGMDKPSKIMSRQYDMIFVDECTELSLDAWQALLTRLRHGRMPYRQIIGACNPDAPTHWLQLRADAGQVTMLHSRHWENPRWYDHIPTPDRADGEIEWHDGKAYRLTPAGVEYIHDVLGSLSGITRLRMLDGLWCAADGIVYENWNPAIHVVDPFPIPEEWPRYWVVDFGYRNPTCVQWWAESPDGQLVMYREIYYRGRLVEDHARQMLRLVTEPVQPPGPDSVWSEEELATDAVDPAASIEAGRRVWTEPRPQAVICDHDAEDRATLHKYLRMGSTAARKTVKRGIEAVESRLKPDARGVPGLVLQRGSLVERDESLVRAGKPACTEEEIPRYVWMPPVNGRSPKEEPLKENDHGADDVRYIVAHRDLRFRVRDRDIGMED
jgi:phage terminase large subunit